ncbi:transposable element Tcb1 transposase [Trichonephila clavipes]|nr:transposable element Tcb1 transposase [Trichonephila clavipes]
MAIVRRYFFPMCVCSGGIGPDFIFMDDNARPHRTLAVEELLETRLHHPANTQQLKQMLIEECVLLPQEMLHQLVLSMRRRSEEPLQFSLLSDSDQTSTLKVPGIRYHQEKSRCMTLFQWCRSALWGGTILCSRTDLHVQIGTMTGQIYRDIILEHNVRLFRGTMDTEFVFMDDNVLTVQAT